MYTDLKGSEDYEHLAIGFKDSFNEINEMIANPALTIEGVPYTLEFFYLLITRYFNSENE